jgi:hypothetical protein
MYIEKKQAVRIWTGFIWLRIGSSGRLLGISTELPVAKKEGNFLTGRAVIPFSAP